MNTKENKNVNEDVPSSPLVRFTAHLKNDKIKCDKIVFSKKGFLFLSEINFFKVFLKMSLDSTRKME